MLDVISSAMSISATAEAWVIRLAVLGLLVSSAEWLANLPMHLPGRGLSSDVQKSQLWLVKRPWMGYVAAIVLTPGGLLTVIGVRAAASVALIYQPLGITSTVLLGIIVVTLCLWVMRSSFGDDGADQMIAIILVALFLGRLFSSGQESHHAALVFIAGQSCLAYFSAGFAKLQGPTWRNGSALKAIVSTEGFGIKMLRVSFVRHPWMSACGCWCVILFELTFPVYLLLDTQVAIGMLCLGLFFHVSNAVVMGLNNFVWAFCATYPAIIFTVSLLTRSHGTPL